MIAKSDFIILSSASVLLLIAVMRLGGPDADVRAPTYYSATAPQDQSGIDGQTTANPADTTVANLTADTATPAVVTTQTVSVAEVGTEDFKQPDVIREAAFTTHVVKQGEYLGLIARRYNTTVPELKRLNNLKGNTILVGQNLVYPSQ